MKTTYPKPNPNTHKSEEFINNSQTQPISKLKQPISNHKQTQSEYIYKLH